MAIESTDAELGAAFAMLVERAVVRGWLVRLLLR